MLQKNVSSVQYNKSAFQCNINLFADRTQGYCFTLDETTKEKFAAARAIP